MGGGGEKIGHNGGTCSVVNNVEAQRLLARVKYRSISEGGKARQEEVLSSCGRERGGKRNKKEKR